MEKETKILVEINPIKSERSKSITYFIENECFICNSHAIGGNGYPQIGKNKKRFRMNRFIYEFFNGEIPEGLHIRHTCDNKICINPNHLITGTHQQNMQDAKERDLFKRGEDVPSAKLTKEQAIEIFNSKLSNVELGRVYNINPSVASNIKHKKKWKLIHE